MGLPVVATRSGGPEEIVEHGRTGLLVAPGDPHELAGGIRRILGDADLCARLAADGQRAALAQFSMSSMLDAYCALYDGPAASSTSARMRSTAEHGVPE